MSNAVIAFLFAVSAATWIYAKVQHRTLSGQTGAIVAGVAGFILFFVFWSIINIFF
ncbi:MAG: hypothetical protein KIH63_004940 [Candidatus Saccharibacteria bacterium]|nr:hypothetical protein [Candidatus Saccharibacteria bacterium]